MSPCAVSGERLCTLLDRNTKSEQGGPKRALPCCRTANAICNNSWNPAFVKMWCFGLVLISNAAAVWLPKSRQTCHAQQQTMTRWLRNGTVVHRFDPGETTVFPKSLEDPEQTGTLEKAPTPANTSRQSTVRGSRNALTNKHMAAKSSDACTGQAILHVAATHNVKHHVSSATGHIINLYAVCAPCYITLQANNAPHKMSSTT